MIEVERSREVRTEVYYKAVLRSKWYRHHLPMD